MGKLGGKWKKRQIRDKGTNAQGEERPVVNNAYYVTVPYPFALVKPTDTATTSAGSPVSEQRKWAEGERERETKKENESVLVSKKNNHPPR